MLSAPRRATVFEPIGLPSFKREVAPAMIDRAHEVIDHVHRVNRHKVVGPRPYPEHARIMMKCDLPGLSSFISLFRHRLNETEIYISSSTLRGPSILLFMFRIQSHFSSTTVNERKLPEDGPRSHRLFLRKGVWRVACGFLHDRVLPRLILDDREGI